MSDNDHNHDTDDSTAHDSTGGTTFDHQLARIAVGAYDDAQDMRTAAMNRIRDIVRKKREGIPFDAVEDEKDPDERDWDSEYEDDNLPDLIEDMLADGLLTDREHEYITMMLDAALTAQQIENRCQRVMRITEAEPIYSEWLDDVYGVSNTLTARLLHRFGYCEQFGTVSQLWAYAGLAPGQKRERGKQLDFDPDAKTLAWLVADSFVKGGDSSRYRREFYDPYKEKQLARMADSACRYCGQGVRDHVNPQDETGTYCTDDCEQEVSPGDFDLGDRHPDNATPAMNDAHADNRARRYVAKQFLAHYWVIARTMRGLDTPDHWVLEQDGHEKRTDVFDYAPFAYSEVTGREAIPVLA